MLNNSSKKEDSCTHNVYIKGLCGNCGIRLDPPQSTSVSMIHSVPELKVSEEYAKEIGKADQERLIRERKLVLLVDLDQTILHTTHEEVRNDPNVHSFTLWPGHPTYYTKLRPHLQEFLEKMSEIYELHIFTFGCRRYAHKIASLIDPDRKFFDSRILSRDESVDQYSKKGNMSNLFPCGDAMVCIIDDRADVWRDATNLIQVKPYSYFKTSISDGAHRKDVVVEDDESLERDVDKLEALLALDDNEIDESKEEDDDDGESDTVSPSEPASTIESDQSEGEQNSDSSEGNLKKKIKISCSDTEGEEKEDDADDGDGGENDRNNVTENCDDKETRKSLEDSTGNCPEENKNGDETTERFSQKAEDLTTTSLSSLKHREQLNNDNDDTDEDSSPDTPPEPIEDPDDQLLHLPNILKRIHDKWYMELDEQRQFLVDGENYKLPDIKDIIRRYLRKKF